MSSGASHLPSFLNPKPPSSLLNPLKDVLRMVHGARRPQSLRLQRLRSSLNLFRLSRIKRRPQIRLKGCSGARAGAETARAGATARTGARAKAGERARAEAAARTGAKARAGERERVEARAEAVQGTLNAIKL